MSESGNSGNFRGLIGAFAENCPFLADYKGPLIVAVSGGADSVAAALAAASARQQLEWQYHLVLAHYNHRWRDDADADAAWVRELARQIEADFFLGQAEVAPHSGRARSEQAAREARYGFLSQTADELGARYVVTAHTRDDQIETVLMRTLRGTGLAGVAGIPAIRSLSPDVTLLRPLLSIGRQQVEAALVERNQAWRTDSTNSSSQFTRNWLRNELLPLVRTNMPHDVDKALVELSHLARDWNQWIGELAAELTTRHVSVERQQGTTKLLIDAPSLLSVKFAGSSIPGVFINEVLRHAWRKVAWPERDMGRGDWLRLAAHLRDAGAAATELPGGVRVSWQGRTLVLAR